MQVDSYEEGVEFGYDSAVKGHKKDELLRGVGDGWDEGQADKQEAKKEQRGDRGGNWRSPITKDRNES